MIGSCVKLAMLAAAILGYGAFYQKRRLPLCFFPAVLVSGVAVMLYGFGFFGALKMGSYAVMLGGVALLVLCRKDVNIRAFFLEPSIWFCLVSGAWLYAITRGVLLSHWDDGSHWYRACKAICMEGAFPTTPDIMYTNYVPGCQLWVYFVLRFLRFSPENCMFAQGLINIACVSSLFAGMRGAKSRLEKGFSAATVAAAGVVLCSMSVGTYGLLVDLQLGLVSLALLVLLLDQEDNTDILVPAALLFAFLLLVKNSAVYFAVMIFLWAAVSQRWRAKRLAVRSVVCLGIPLALRFAYSIREGIVYSGVAASPQSVSLNRLAQLFSQKKAEDVWTFTKRFLQKLFIGDTGLPSAVYLCVLLLVLLWLCLKAEKKIQEAQVVRRNLIFGVTMTVLYAVILYGMYIFAMERFEMLIVNSFYRYYGTMVVLFAGMTIYTAMRCIMRAGIGAGSARVYVLGMVLFAVMAMPGAYSNLYIWGRNYYNLPEGYGPSFWRTMKDNIPENRMYSGLHYVVFWDPDHFGDCISTDTYAEYTVSAWMRPKKVDVISRISIREGLSQEQIEAIQSCDQFIFMSDMTAQRKLLAPYMDVSDLTIGLRYK